MARGKRITFLAAAVAASVFATAACGGTEQARADAEAAAPESGQKTVGRVPTPAAEAKTEGNGNDRAVARAGGAKAGAGGAGARAGEAAAGVGESEARAGGVRVTGEGQEVAGGSAEERKDTREVALTVTGKPGTRFAGSCSVGGKERELKGEVPKRYTFEPRNKKLECGVRNEDAGPLGIVVDDGGSVHSEQSTGAGGSTMRFVYSGGDLVSTSTSSITVQQQQVTSSEEDSSGDRE